jgi:hypothetical protein
MWTFALESHVLAHEYQEALQEAAELHSEQSSVVTAPAPASGAAPVIASLTKAFSSPTHLDATMDTFATPTQDVTEEPSEHACADPEEGAAAAG